MTIGQVLNAGGNFRMIPIHEATTCPSHQCRFHHQGTYCIAWLIRAHMHRLSIESHGQAMERRDHVLVDETSARSLNETTPNIGYETEIAVSKDCCFLGVCAQGGGT